jgi:hypothetical protein
MKFLKELFPFLGTQWVVSCLGYFSQNIKIVSGHVI